MLFASFSYLLIFLPIVVCIAIVLRKFAGPRVTQVWVVFASIFFYARSNPLNLTYLAASIVVNWLLAQAIDRAEEPQRKRILVSALVLNVAYLCAFKYLAFFASLIAFTLPKGYVVPSLGFPLGISFFTISQIMYMVDVYQETLDHGSFFDHATFVLFFPYLISGPLGRAKRMRHQFNNFGGIDGTRTKLIARGFYLFSLGLFKKCVFANAFAQLAHNTNHVSSNVSALEAWIFSIAYVMEVYFDFSGYSDMAIGSALMLGIDIPRNFDSPFSATSIIDFWQRWHISLTGFITSYLFTPIFKSFRKRTLLTSSIATFLAMGIAGFWHGAGWTFIIYGLLHGTYLAINQIWRKKNLPKIPGFAGWILTAIAVDVAFIYFGADSAATGTRQLLELVNFHHPFAVNNLTSIGMIVDGFGPRFFALPLFAGFLISIFGPSSEQRGRDFVPTGLNCGYAVVLTAISFLMMNSTIPVPFVYFHF